MLDYIFIATILLLVLFFHELCHWIPAKLLKVNRGFIYLKWYGAAIKLKPTTIKNALIIGNAGVWIPAALYCLLYLATGMRAFFLLFLIQMACSVGDAFFLFLYWGVSLKYGINSKIKKYPGFWFFIDIDWHDVLHEKEKKFQKL